MAARSSLRWPGACDSLLLAATSRPSTSGYGSHGGFGKKPALLVIDVSYGFTGDKPEPILDSIKQWRNSCGAESWTAIATSIGVRSIELTTPTAIVTSSALACRRPAMTMLPNEPSVY
jgi:hypothetical protein